MIAPAQSHGSPVHTRLTARIEPAIVVCPVVSSTPPGAWSPSFLVIVDATIDNDPSFETPPGDGDTAPDGLFRDTLCTIVERMIVAVAPKRFATPAATEPSATLSFTVESTSVSDAGHELPLLIPTPLFELTVLREIVTFPQSLKIPPML